MRQLIFACKYEKKEHRIGVPFRQKKNGFLFFFCLFRFSYVLIACLSFNQLGFVIFISYVAGADNVLGLELDDFKLGAFVLFFNHITHLP